jgi:predicted Zn-dependent protease
MGSVAVYSLVLFLTCAVSPVSLSLTLDYPKSLANELNRLLAGGAEESSDPVLLLTLAELYLDMGNDLFVTLPERRSAYEEGAKAAAQALQLHEADTRAHFLYAANLGSAARLKGVVASAWVVKELKAHVSRALELKNDYAPALHMMGMLLEELPWILGGDAAAALHYLQRAVTVKPSYAHARLDLAKAYIKRNNPHSARRELNAIINMEEPTNPYAWRHRNRPEAERLLAEIEGH